MRRIAFFVVAVMLPFSFAGCDDYTEPTGPMEGEVTYDDGSNFGDLGMTYNGKLGYDNGLGQVQPYDGSAPSFGYGF